MGNNKYTKHIHIRKYIYIIYIYLVDIVERAWAANEACEVLGKVGHVSETMLTTMSGVGMGWMTSHIAHVLCNLKYAKQLSVMPRASANLETCHAACPLRDPQHCGYALAIWRVFVVAVDVVQHIKRVNIVDVLENLERLRQVGGWVWQQIYMYTYMYVYECMYLHVYIMYWCIYVLLCASCVRMR